MKKILVPTDFSENARIALNYAFDLTRGIEAEIHVLNVLSKPPNTSGSVGSLFVRMKENAQQDMQRLLDDMELEGRRVEPYIREGSAVATIVAIGEDIQADCIVMGTKGESSLDSVILGSNAAGVIEKSSVPVLAVPGEYVFKGLDRVVYATDLQKSGPSVAGHLLAFTEPFSSRIDVVHIHKPGDEPPVVQMDLLKKEMQDASQNRMVRFHLHEHESIKEGILNFMDASGAELLVMVTKKRNLIQKLFDKSLTQKVAYITSTPLMTYQAG